jgi:hypothetical protein
MVFLNWRRGIIILIGALVIGLIGTVIAAPREPSWKVGRAVIQNDERKDLSLKLSLRNEGKPGKTPVKILGRWKGKQNKEFTLLSQLTKEIELKQTAVVIIALELLKPIPPGTPSLELLVMTGSRETDQKVVRLP